jgi:hypothetical protein
MKIRLVVALVGLAFGFAVPGIAQQKDTVDPQVAEQLSALSKKTDESYNNGDAAVLAAPIQRMLFFGPTQDRFTRISPSASTPLTASTAIPSCAVDPARGPLTTWERSNMLYGLLCQHADDSGVFARVWSLEKWGSLIQN